MTKILVVDDEPSITNLVSAYLKPEGYEVYTASNGDAGLKAARAFKPDLIILDVMLPGMLNPMAANSIAARTIPVILGLVRSTLLNNARRRKEAFCNHIFRRAFGQRRLSHFGFLSGGVSTAPRWIHSPGRGIGQTAHQPRP